MVDVTLSTNDEEIVTYYIYENDFSFFFDLLPEDCRSRKHCVAIGQVLFFLILSRSDYRTFPRRTFPKPEISPNGHFTDCISLRETTLDGVVVS